MEKTKTHLRFEAIAVKCGIRDFELGPQKVRPGNLQPYKKQAVQQAFIMFMAGIEDGKANGGGHYIIGKMEYWDGKRTPKFSQNPVIHDSKFSGKKELKRLSEECPNQVFVLYASITSSSKRNISAEGNMNLKTNFATFADDGFGNRTKVPFELRVKFTEENQVDI